MSLRKSLVECNDVQTEKYWVIYVKHPIGKTEMKYRKHSLPSEILNLFGDELIQYNWCLNKKGKLLIELSTDIEYIAFQRNSVRFDRDVCVFD